MATILMAWELGGGLGHAANLLPLVRRLGERGHQVHLALRDLSVGHRLASANVRLWQAPFKNSRPKAAVSEPRSFADILFNCGFGDAAELRSLTEAWRQILDAVRPEVLVCEHSPTALLAARGRPLSTVVAGTGFCCPTPEAPLRDLRTWHPKAMEQRAEPIALQQANAVLAALGMPPLTTLGELFAGAAATFLQTCAALDPYAPRAGGEYVGVWPQLGGKPPQWPGVPGQRVFAYLKPFPALPQLLEVLRELRAPVIVVGDGIDRAMQRKFATPALRFESEPLSMRDVLRDCEAAICNGNHGTTMALLGAGKPALYLPLHLEQTLNGLAVQRLGAGLMASIRRPAQISVRLLEVLRDPKYRQGAARIAPQIRDLHAQDHLERMVARIEGLAAAAVC